MKHKGIKNTLLYSSLLVGAVAFGHAGTVHADVTNQATQKNEGVTIQTTQSNSSAANSSASSSVDAKSSTSSSADANSSASNSANTNSSTSSSADTNSSASSSADTNSSASSQVSSVSDTSSSASSQAYASSSASNESTASSTTSDKSTSNESTANSTTSDNVSSDKSVSSNTSDKSTVSSSSDKSNSATSAVSSATSTNETNSLEAAISSATNELNRAGSDATSSGQVGSLNDKLSSLQAQLSAASSAAAAASSAEAIKNMTADIKTKDITLTPGSTYDPRDNFISATDANGKNISFDDLTDVSTNVNTAKGIQPKTYTVTYTYHKSSVTANVTIVNNAGMTLRRNDTDHPYISYANDNFNQLSLITSLKDDDGNNVDPTQAVNDGRLTLTSDSSSFPEGSGAGYYLTFDYRPDGPTLAPVFQGRVKIYTINNSSAKTNAINVVYGSTYDVKDGISNLVNSEGQNEDYDTAIKNGDLTIAGTDKISTTVPGTYPLTYTYFGKVYNANVNVLDKSDLGLANATAIKAGNSFDPSTGVSAITDATGKATNYDTVTKDGALKVVGLDKLNTNTPGTYTVDYQYAGKSHPYTVVVQSQKSLNYVQNPTAIYTGDSINQSGLFKSFTNDTGQTISYDDAVKNGLQVDLSAVNTNTVGDYIGKAIYGDKEYPIEVQVQAKPVQASQAPTSSTSSSSTPASSSATTTNTSNAATPNSSSTPTSSSANTTNTSKTNTVINSAATESPVTNEQTTPQYVEKKVGKKVELYVKNATVTYKNPGITEESRVGLYGRKAGYAKVYAQLVNTNVGLRYKLSNGQYIDATEKALSHFVQASAHQVQITKPVKVYKHLFKHSKSVRELTLGTIVYTDKTIIKNNQPYYKVTSHDKTYYIKASHTNVSSTVGLIKKMDVYVHGSTTIYKNPKQTKKAFALKKDATVAAKLLDYNKNGNWKIEYGVKKADGKIKRETGYVNGSALLKANKIYNNVFGTAKK